MPDLKMIMVVVLAILFVSCATPTPPGQLTDADFLSREVTIDLPVSKVAAQLREGFRYCGQSSGGAFFVTRHGIPERMPVQEDGSILCDLYLAGGWGERSSWVLGRIELRPVDVGTAAILRVQTYVANKDRILESWELFLRSRAKDVCPGSDTGR